MTDSGPSLDQVRAMMRDHGVRRLLVKFLSPNDNSKNQVYLGGDLGVMNIIPAEDPVAGTSGSHKEPIFKAAVKLSWLDAEGRLYPAPSTQLILYPQYPEVRMSGFLRGAAWAPNEVMTVRTEGRVLILGIRPAGDLVAFATGPDTSLARQLRDESGGSSIGIFRELSLSASGEEADSRVSLLQELCRISNSGWIAGWRLAADGSRQPCKGSNCVGVTLESELGIAPNGRSEPDFLGWEVKAHTVASLNKPGSAAMTLMTPEPTGGYYVEAGVIAFVKRFGYKDKRGREDRINFGGIHRVGVSTPSTGLKLHLRGYDVETDTLVSSDGALELITDREVVAASWNFAGLLSHWRRKHARAAFVPAQRRANPEPEFLYGDQVLLAEGTDYSRLLGALARGDVYYDPGIKVENLSSKPIAKRRSQFRVSRSRLKQLYKVSSSENACLVER